MLDTTDRPFALPPRELISTVVDLPFPPSLNHIWKFSRKGVRPSPVYEKWKKHADGLAAIQKIGRIAKMIRGPFTASILFKEGNRGDLDNLAKAVFDWAQSRRLILNDKHCRELTLKWTRCDYLTDGAGCRLILVELA